MRFKKYFPRYEIIGDKIFILRVNEEITGDLIIPAFVRDNLRYQVYLPDNCNNLFSQLQYYVIDLRYMKDLSNIQCIDDMFKGCVNLESVYLGRLILGNRAKMFGMFSDCNELKDIQTIDLYIQDTFDEQRVLNNLEAEREFYLGKTSHFTK